MSLVLAATLPNGWLIAQQRLNRGSCPDGYAAEEIRSRSLGEFTEDVRLLVGRQGLDERRRRFGIEVLQDITASLELRMFEDFGGEFDRHRSHKFRGRGWLKSIEPLASSLPHFASIPQRATLPAAGATVPHQGHHRHGFPRQLSSQVVADATVLRGIVLALLLGMRTLLVVVVGLVLGACAAMRSAENEFFLDVYWTVARECEAQDRTFHVERIAPDGGLSLSAAADSRVGAAEFRECYWTGVPARVERRRAAGLPVPQDANLHPDIDIA